MNGKNLFQGLSYVGEDLIEQAEYGEFSKHKYGNASRILLVAALAALLLMMVGCTLVLALNMRNLRLGSIMESRPVFSGENLDVSGYEKCEMQMLSLNGLKNASNYQAEREWFAFVNEYDPERSLYVQLVQENAIPAELAQYDPKVYTMEMKDKLDAILTKYHLLPQGKLLDFRTVKNLCAALDIEKIQKTDNDTEIQITYGYSYSNGNFGLTMHITLPETEESQFSDTWGYLTWCRKDCLGLDYVTIDESLDWREWNYTTSSGNSVLIFRSQSDQRGWIVCQREEAQMVLQLEVRKEVYGGPEIEYQYMTDRQIEMIADAIDFSVNPKRVSEEDVLNQPPYIPGIGQNGWNIELRDVQTDGYEAQILLGITAPEDTDISHVEEQDTLSEFFDLYPGNRVGFFAPEQGETSGANWYWCAIGDNDGLDNTQNYLMTYKASMCDGSVPFAEGTVWNLHIEELWHHYWDATTNAFSMMMLSDGEWMFQIRFGTGDGECR